MSAYRQFNWRCCFFHTLLQLGRQTEIYTWKIRSWKWQIFAARLAEPHMYAIVHSTELLTPVLVLSMCLHSCVCVCVQLNWQTGEDKIIFKTTLTTMTMTVSTLPRHWSTTYNSNVYRSFVSFGFRTDSKPNKYESVLKLYPVSETMAAVAVLCIEK